MRIEKTPLKDCYLIHDTVFRDKRGYFFESFNSKTFSELTGIKVDFVQDNQSKSSRGVLRGLHFQNGNYAQTKLVRVLQGEVLDVAVDLRPTSVTFGKYFSTTLSKSNNKQLFIPRGFAHGFIVKSDSATLFYKCDNFYNKNSESGIIYNDKDLDIDWQFDLDKIIITDKDLKLLSFRDWKKTNKI